MADKNTTTEPDGARRWPRTLGARLGLVLATVVIAATLATGALEFSRGRDALVARAQTLLEARQRLVTERLVGAIEQRRRLVLVWAQLEAAQDLALEDVDKRLASGLIQLAGSFDDASVAVGIDTSGVIIAASELRWMGVDARERPWFSLQRPDSAGASLALSTDPGLGTVVAAWAGVASRTTGAPLGRLVLLTPWAALLEQAAGAEGASLEIRGAGGAVLQPAASPADARLEALASVIDLGEDTVRLALTLPLADALAPLRASRRQLAVQAFLVLLVTLPAVLLLASSTTAALRRLTERARQVQATSRASPAEDATPMAFAVTAGAPSEVRVLAGALTTMMERVEASRAELARQESLAAMGTMAAVLAHEIRTPLAVLRGSADMLGKRLAGDDRAVELVAFVDEEVRRLERLVNDLLVFARPRTPELEPADLGDVVQRAVRTLEPAAGEAGVKLETILDPAPVTADEEQMLQVALNLVSNAIDASPRGASIRILTACDGETARLEVEDLGRGIPAEALTQIWTPFFTTRRGGTGLGLPLVRRIARDHGGEADLTSEPGVGTRVWLTLPARKDSTT